MSKRLIAGVLVGAILLTLGACASKEMVFTRPAAPPPPPPPPPPPAELWLDPAADPLSGETYAPLAENPLKQVSAEPVSTFHRR